MWLFDTHIYVSGPPTHLQINFLNNSHNATLSPNYMYDVFKGDQLPSLKPLDFRWSMKHIRLRETLFVMVNCLFYTSHAQDMHIHVWVYVFSKTITKKYQQTPKMSMSSRFSSLSGGTLLCAGLIINNNGIIVNMFVSSNFGNQTNLIGKFIVLFLCSFLLLWR